MLVPSLKEERIRLRNRDTTKSVSNKMCIRTQENGVIKESFPEEAVAVLGPEGRTSEHLGIFCLL